MANIKKILELLGTIAKEKKLSTPFICGGLPRDKLLDNIENIDDLDITTGDTSVHTLAQEFGRIIEPIGGHYLVLQDGHAQVSFDGIKIDFSSHYIAPGVEVLLKKAGLKKPTSMLMEMISRDFTVNSLLMTLDLKTIKDPTGLGINDIKKKRLRTCLPANIALGNDNKRIIRVIYLAAKLGFVVDDEIKDWIIKNPAAIANVKPKYLSKKLQQAINYNLEKTVELIDELGLWKYLPILPELMPYATKSGRMI
jgi:tRNA nucleotidyltransferase/poly(A) polymerase